MTRKFAISIAALALAALAGCSAQRSQQIAADAQQLFPPTAENLAPSCSAASPTQVQDAACQLYKFNVALCAANLAAVGGVFGGAAMFVPAYGPAIAAAVGTIQPVISADQLWWCAETGYIQKSAAPAQKTASAS
jgi:hypothetical protein